MFCLSAYTCVISFLVLFEINVQGMLGVDSASARPCFDSTTVATTMKPNINENHFDIKIANIVHKAFWNDQYFMSIDIES